MQLKSHLSAIPDHRRAQGRMYDLAHLLLFSILAVASGATSYRKIQRFMDAHRERLNDLCQLHWKRAPAHNSIRYALQGLDAKAVERAFRHHASDLDGERAQHAGIAMDGKTLRGSFDHFEDRKAAQVLSALATESTLVLGHVWITDDDGEKHHEIQAAQQLIETLGLSDRLFTLDALHTQKTTQLVIATGNHVLVQLKRNQPLLHDARVEHTRGHPFVDEHHTDEIGQRNRIENRTVHVWHLHPGIGSEPWHDHFRTLIRVQRHTERFDTQLRDWRVSEERAYYLCDLVLPAARFNEAIRNHWRVENRAHYVRDTRFQEDASRIRRNPCIFALLPQVPQFERRFEDF